MMMKAEKQEKHSSISFSLSLSLSLTLSLSLSLSLSLFSLFMASRRNLRMCGVNCQLLPCALLASICLLSVQDVNKTLGRYSLY